MAIVIPAQDKSNSNYEYLLGLAPGFEDFVWRGKPLSMISRGERVYLYADKKIWGWMEFVGYETYRGEDNQGNVVAKENAMRLRRPKVEFPTPLPVERVFNRVTYLRLPKVPQSLLEKIRQHFP